MSTILLVQAVIVATSGRMYKTKPREFRQGGADLAEWQSALRSDLRLGQFPIDFVNDHGHDQTIMPHMVETIIFNTLGARQEYVQTEPNYEALKAGWNETLHPERPVADAEQTQVIPVVSIPPMPETVPPSDATLHEHSKPVPKPAPPKTAPPAPVAAQARRVGTGKVEAIVNPDGSKSWRFATPGPVAPSTVSGVFDIRSEQTQEMAIPSDPDSDDPTVAQRTIERAAAPTRATEQPRRGALSGRRSQRRGGSGKVTQD